MLKSIRSRFLAIICGMSLPLSLADWQSGSSITMKRLSLPGRSMAKLLMLI